MGQYNREVINAYREAGCTQCFIMGRIDATDIIPAGSHRNEIIEAPSGEYEFTISSISRE